MNKRKQSYGAWARARHWGKVRGRFVLTLWAVIGSLGSLGLGFLPTESSFREKAVDKLNEFADPWLIGVLFGSAILIVGAISLFSNPDSPTWRDGIAEEFSEAASSFAAITLVLCAWEASSRSSIHWWNLILAVLMLLAGIWLCKVEEESLPANGAPAQPVVEEERPADYGITFIDPVDGAKVQQSTLVHGTALKDAPLGKELWLVRRFGNRQGEIYPLNKLTLQKKDRDGLYEWWVPGAWVGGEPGIRDVRYFEVWLVGREGARVFNHYSDWETHINEKRGELDKALADVPEAVREKIDVRLRSQPLKYMPEDVVFLAERRVERA